VTTPASSTFYWKRHDTAPVIQCILEDSSGNAIDLTGASIKFIMAVTVGGTALGGTGTIVGSPTLGTVSYQPTSTDTAAAGTYLAEWEVTFASGKKETFPDPGYLTVIITADVDNA
jgi:hypothetical protein